MVTRQAELFRALAEELALEILTSYTEDDFRSHAGAGARWFISLLDDILRVGRSAAAKTRVSGNNPLHCEWAVVGYVPLCEVSL